LKTPFTDLIDAHGSSERDVRSLVSTVETRPGFGH